MKKLVIKLFNRAILWAFGWKKQWLMTHGEVTLYYKNPKTGIHFLPENAIDIIESKLRFK